MIVLNIEEKDVDLILRSLSEKPYREVAPLIDAIVQQINFGRDDENKTK